MTSLWKPGGRLWIPSAPSDRIQVDSEGFIRDVNTDDMFPVEVPSIGEVDAVSAKLDEKGIHRPIKDGLDDDGMGTLSADCPSVLTPSTVGAAARLLSTSPNSLMISFKFFVAAPQALASFLAIGLGHA